MLYIVCLHHCMYVCYMFIKYQSINPSLKPRFFHNSQRQADETRRTTTRLNVVSTCCLFAHRRFSDDNTTLNGVSVCLSACVCVVQTLARLKAQCGTGLQTLSQDRNTPPVENGYTSQIVSAGFFLPSRS